MTRILNRSACHCLLVLAACAVAVTAIANDEFEHAKKLYDTYCAQCHGMGRDGKGINSPTMSTAPRNHLSENIGNIPEAEMEKIIREGGLAVNKSVLMPGWESVMSDEEIKGMVSYLYEICCRENK